MQIACPLYYYVVFLCLVYIAYNECYNIWKSGSIKTPGSSMTDVAI